MNKNKLSLGFLLILVMLIGIAVGSVTVYKANAAATTAETGTWSSADGFQTYPVAINWSLSTDVSYLVSLPSSYGPPIGYKQIQFQDLDNIAGGYGDDVGQGSGVIAEELENTFIAIEEYGGTGIEAYQITVYRQEYDGTVPTCDSVVSYGEFIFAPIDGFFGAGL